MISYRDMLAMVKKQWPELRKIDDKDNDTSKVNFTCFLLRPFCFGHSKVKSKVVVLS